MTEKTLEEELSEAFDNIEAAQDDEQQTITAEVADDADEFESEGVEDTGDDTAEDDLASDISDALDAGSSEEEGGDIETDTTPAETFDKEHQAEVEAARPPNSWTPAAREHWKDIPPSVQAEITKRENETAATLTHTAQQRELAEAFENTIAPFKAVMAAEGATNPLQAIENTFNVVATLRMGNEPTKAAMVARLMQTYGVTVDSLADAIEGIPPTEQPRGYTEADVQNIVNQTLAKNQNQQVVSSVSEEMAVFRSNNEFFDDLRSEMGVLAQVAAQKNEATSWQDLYDKAIAMRPDIQQILAGRRGATPAESTKSDLRAKKAAAKSLKGSKQSHPGDAAPKLNSHEDFVRDAIDQLQ